MSFTATTCLAAATIANRLRAIYGRDGWVVTIVRPLFAGDTYRVNVN